MAYIYCIENLINHKKYIGKTLFSVEKRYKKHWLDAHNLPNISNRPLYKAFLKYGQSAFQVYTIEKCDATIVNEREIYGIDFFDTFHNGYNATLGGDGSQIYPITEKELYKFFNQHGTPQQVADYYGCCKDTITHYSQLYGINGAGNTQRHDIECFYQDEYIGSFYSAGDAARGIIEEGLSTAQIDSIRTNIMRCCKGTRQTAYKFVGHFK